jgi:hypothetical protein
VTTSPATKKQNTIPPDRPEARNTPDHFSRLLKVDWPRTLEEMEALQSRQMQSALEFRGRGVDAPAMHEPVDRFSRRLPWAALALLLLARDGSALGAQ